MTDHGESTYPVVHHLQQKMFSIELQNGEQAVLKYRLSAEAAPGVAVDFYRTFVPEAYRHKNLAAKLVQDGLDWARQQQLLISASCWYVAKKLKASELSSLLLRLIPRSCWLNLLLLVASVFACPFSYKQAFLLNLSNLQG